MGGGKRVNQVEDVLSLGDKVQVVVREIDDRGKVSLDLGEGVELTVKEGASAPRVGGDGGGRDRDRGDRGGRDRDRGDRGGRDRDRGDRGGRDRDRDRGARERSDRDRAPVQRQDSQPSRTVVSFEDEFESGQ
jgi:polyribonucleotide nucleotidyltransferase